MNSFSPIQINDALEKMRSVNEDVLRDEIVKPMLEALGRKFVRINHGTGERGKDFVFIDTDELLGDVLCVCQVKNERITGSSTSANGVSGIIYQLNMAKQSLVLNPISSQKELPARVEFLNTFPLPDGGTGDLGNQLQQLRQIAVVIAPERFASLALKFVPQFFFKESVKGQRSISSSVRRYVELNHEARAFNCSTSELIPSLFVDPGFTHDLNLNRDEESNVTMTWKKVDVALAAKNGINVLWSHLTGCDLLEKSGTTEIDDKTITEIEARLDEMRSFAFPSTEKVLKEISEAFKNSLAEQAIKICDLLEFFRVILRFVEQDVDDQLANRIRGALKKEVESSAQMIQPKPREILDAECDIAVIGQAGFGKTFLTRMIATLALDSNQTCMFIPCNRVESEHSGLSVTCENFMEMVSDVAPEDLSAFTKNLDVLILDGCDEAPSYPEKLGDQIRDFVHPSSEIVVEIDERGDLYIPKLFSKRIRKFAKGTRLGFSGRMSTSEAMLLKACNTGGISGSMNQKAISDLCNRARLVSPRKVILATRDLAGMGEFDGLQSLRLRPFDDRQLKQFFEKRLANDKGAIESILTFLDANPNIQDTARAPMMASIIAGLQQGGIPLPVSRADIYEKRFALLLGEWDSTRGVDRRCAVSSPDKMRFLQKIASSMHGKHTQNINQVSLRQIWTKDFSHVYSTVSFDSVLNELTSKNCVLYEHSNGEFTLGHLSYQEFLTARFLLFAGRSSFVGEKIDQKWWQNVARFYAGLATSIEPVLAAAQENGFFSTQQSIISELIAECRNTPPQFKNLISELLLEP